LNAPDGVAALLVRHCEFMDAADWGAVGDLFVDAVLLAEDGSQIARGRDGVAAFYRNGTRLYDGSPHTKHLVLNSVVVQVDDTSALVRSSYVVLQALDDFPLQPIINGRYVDRFRQRNNAWTFAERRFFVDLVGDLSRHLTYELRGRSSSGTG
jgi:3-phenylpropionate/cinnamic acid dioxygenase small subunit